MSSGFDPGLSIADATNVLLVAPAVGDTAVELCCDALAFADPTPDHVLGVTITGSPRDKLETWQERLNHEATFSFVTVDGVARSTAVGVETDATSPAPVTVERLDSVTPLSGLGRAIAGQLDEGTNTAVCFHSVTDLLEYVDREPAFKFLHVVGSRIRTSGATGYFHIDGTAHDEATMNTFATLCDAVVDLGDHSDGGETA